VKVLHFGVTRELLGVIPSTENVMVGYDINDYEDSVIEDIKPYLRPMSGMTEEEKRQYGELCDEDIRQLTSVQIVHPGLKYKTSCHRSIEWLNANHFDYRRLIEKGLALEAPADVHKK
jgi:hypothetical protein